MHTRASCIYKGWVNHQRYQPKVHGFSYQVFMMYLDLDELPNLFDHYRYWSYLRRNLAWFNRADYFGDPRQPLKEEISQLLLKATGQAAQGPVRLLTNMRYFGHCFNPVSFYYCFKADGTTLQAIVSHITNTPWGEDYAYVHDYALVENEAISTKDKRDNGMTCFKLDKTFHVSPFMPMDVQYEWSFKHDASSLLVHMKNYRLGQELFNASLSLHPEPIYEKTLNRLLVRYPFMTIKVVFAIYWQALLLWLKRVPFYSHPSSIQD
jgi:DUF1365 family protein